MWAWSPVSRSVSRSTHPTDMGCWRLRGFFHRCWWRFCFFSAPRRGRMSLKSVVLPQWAIPRRTMALPRYPVSRQDSRRPREGRPRSYLSGRHPRIRAAVRSCSTRSSFRRTPPRPGRHCSLRREPRVLIVRSIPARRDTTGCGHPTTRGPEPGRIQRARPRRAADAPPALHPTCGPRRKGRGSSVFRGQRRRTRAPARFQVTRSRHRRTEEPTGVSYPKTP